MMRHFQIEVNGYCCKTEMIFDLLMKASAECSSLEAACADLEKVADSNTVREYVNKFLPVDQLSEQEAAANQTLAECIPEKMARKGIEVGRFS